MTFGSLFAGIGGMDLGLERAGLECRWQVEINPFATRVLEKHWPGVRRRTDIRDFEPEPAEEWHVDLICGGDPCQGNSQARGSRDYHETSPADHFLRIVDRLRPALVLRENPSATRSDAPWPWYRFRSELESLGYAVLPFRLRACCFGADHRRDRLFLLAELADTMRTGLERQDSRVVKHGHSPRCARGRPTPRLCRRVDGIPDRVDRIRTLGNAVDPFVAEYVGRLILEHHTEIAPC